MQPSLKLMQRIYSSGSSCAVCQVPRSNVNLLSSIGMTDPYVVLSRVPD